MPNGRAHESTRFEQLCDRLRAFFGRDSVALFVAALVVLVKLLPSTGADPDLFARVAMGRLTTLFGAVPTSDPFAFTPKHPLWIDHEWLSGVVFYWIAVNFGDVGLYISKLILPLWSLVFVFRCARLVAPEAYGTLLWITLCFMHASFAWASTIRCQAFTYLFVPVTLYALLTYRANGERRYLLLLPLLTLPWANMHGGFTLGLIIQASFVAAEMWRRKRWQLPATIFALSVAATAFNPYGFGTYWGYILSALSMHRTSISEWSPVWRDSVTFWSTLPFAIAVAWGMWLRRGRVDLWHAFLLAFATYSGFRHIRLVAFMMITYGVFALPLFSLVLSRIKEHAARRFVLVERAASLCIALGLPLVLGSECIRLLAAPFSLDYSIYPVSVCNWLRNTQPPGQRVLVDFNGGSLALWRLYPHSLISIDGRYEEVYPAEVETLVARAFEFGTEEGKAALAIVGPTFIIARKTRSAAEIERELGAPWRAVYEDERFAGFSTSAAVSPNAPLPPIPPMWKPLF
jgi:hypothetical protein